MWCLTKVDNIHELTIRPSACLPEPSDLDTIMVVSYNMLGVVFLRISETLYISTNDDNVYMRIGDH